MKKTVPQIILDLVFLLVFNAVFFILGGTEHSVSVWLSYGFIHFAYLMVLITPILTRKSGGTTVVGFSICAISSIYFLVEFIIGLVFVFRTNASVEITLVVQIIITGLYAVVLLSSLLVNERTVNATETQENEVAYIKAAASRIQLLMLKAPNRDARKSVERVYDVIHTSPTRSSPLVYPIEMQIENLITKLEEAVKANKSADVITLSSEIISLIEERNSNTKFSK
mgnify:CR=1 FL=1